MTPAREFTNGAAFKATTAVTAFLFVTLVCGIPATAQTRSGWQEEWNSVVATAKREGRVVVWGGPGQQIRQALTEGFRRAFPEINLEYTGGPGSQHATKLAAERAGGVYNVDVIVLGADTLTVRVKPMKALDPLRPALLLPEVTETKNWRDNRLEFSDAEQQRVLAFVGQGTLLLAYDPKQAKPDEVSKLYDLLAPNWKGKIAVSDPTTPGAGMAWFHWVWNVLGPERAQDYYRKLKDQTGVVSRDWRRLLEWIGHGRYAMLVGPSINVAEELRNEGVQLGTVWEFEDFGSWLTPSNGTVSLVNRAPHPNAAKVFINWLLTKDGQTIWSKAMTAVSRRLDVPTDHLPAGTIPRPGGKYWLNYLEHNLTPAAEETRVIKELFGQ
jgi:ABC-type Fe3+ transport system substrate-binding protein